MKPFLKWAGNKYRIVDRIKAILPEGDRLIEPFVGSGAVFLNTNYRNYLLADANPDLINLYRTVRDQGSEFINHAREYFLPKFNCPAVYYQFRDNFNETKNMLMKACLFLYLNRYGYNGLCRYNASGKFNVPFGRYEQPYFPERELEFFYEKSQRAEFFVSGFEETMCKARIGDVVYCDPPYVPISTSANFTTYSVAGFGRSDQHKLLAITQALQGFGIPVIISNSDCEMTRTLYSQAKQITAFDVPRSISCDGENRKKAKEILAVY